MHPVKAVAKPGKDGKEISREQRLFFSNKIKKGKKKSYTVESMKSKDPCIE